MKNAEVIVLFRCPLVDLDLYFGVVLRCIWVVDEAVVRRVIQDQSKWLLPILVTLKLVDELHELIVSLTVSSAERIVGFELLDQLHQETLDRRVQTS